MALDLMMSSPDLPQGNKFIIIFITMVIDTITIVNFTAVFFILIVLVITVNSLSSIMYHYMTASLSIKDNSRLSPTCLNPLSQLYWAKYTDSGLTVSICSHILGCILLSDSQHCMILRAASLVLRPAVLYLASTAVKSHTHVFFFLAAAQHLQTNLADIERTTVITPLLDEICRYENTSVPTYHCCANYPVASSQRVFLSFTLGVAEFKRRRRQRCPPVSFHNTPCSQSYFSHDCLPQFIEESLALSARPLRRNTRVGRYISCARPCVQLAFDVTTFLLAPAAQQQRAAARLMRSEERKMSE